MRFYPTTEEHQRMLYMTASDLFVKKCEAAKEDGYQISAMKACAEDAIWQASIFMHTLFPNQENNK